MLTRFENYLRNIKGYSDRTCSEYLKDLKGFAKWAKAYKEDARWSTLTRSDIDEYITMRSKEGIKPATTNRELAAISASMVSARITSVTKEDICSLWGLTRAEPTFMVRSIC